MIRYPSCSPLLHLRAVSRRGDRRPGNQYSVVDELSFGLATVLAIESLDAARRIDQLLLAREERVAVRADLKPNLRFGRARLPRLAARAMHVEFTYFG